MSLLFSLAVETGLEPATPCVTGTYSNQLNYPTFPLKNADIAVKHSLDSMYAQIALLRTVLSFKSGRKNIHLFGLCNLKLKIFTKVFGA